MDTISTIRHTSIFDSTRWNLLNIPITIIGAGSVGSKIALELAKLGVENITVYDFDVVEAHNIANQAFRMADIGQLKVEALKSLVLESTGLEITAINEKVEAQSLEGVVFLAVDTISARKEIFSKSINLNPMVNRVFEVRMASDQGELYQINPMNFRNVEVWEETLNRKITEDRSACGGTISVGPTSSLLASFTAWKFMDWSNSLMNGVEYDVFKTLFMVNITLYTVDVLLGDVKNKK